MREKTNTKPCESPDKTAGTVLGGLRAAVAVRLCAAGLAAVAVGLCALPAPALTVDGTNAADALDALANLQESSLIIDYDGSSPYDEVKGWIASAYNGGNWTGSGIIAACNADDYALGLADTANPAFRAPADLEGEPFDDTSVLVKYTFYADANLDGQVGTKDVTALINGWNGAYTGDPRWTVGDFNYDGQIGTKDVTKLINSWNAHSGDEAPEYGAHTPEPVTLTGLVLGLGSLATYLSRRRNNSGRRT